MKQPTTVLIGRDTDIARLSASRARLTLLTGDSGIGKSTVLAAAQERTGDAICPPPQTLPASGGVLQRMLLDSLGEVVAMEVAARGRAAEAGRHIADAAERLVLQRGQDLARLIGYELLSVVRGRLGPEFGNATAGFLKSLKKSVDHRLAVRLEGVLDRTAVTLVVDMATEVAEFLGNDGAVIAYDAGERLPETDLRVLVDVAESLPSRMRLRVAFAVYSAQHRSAIERLRSLSSAVAEIQLTGIGQDAVVDWLEAEGLSANLAEEAARVTMGYPLHVADLIAHLRDGGVVEDVPLHMAFAARTDEAWQGLDPQIAACARKLCVLADPLDDALAVQLLAVDASTWGEIQERLARARIFSGAVNGMPWFHEQRRRYLAEIKLSEHERAQACEDAALLLIRTVGANGQRLGEIADLVASASGLLERDQMLKAATNLGRSELAICASLIELMEPAQATPAVDGEQLVRYARNVFAGEGDLVAAFRGLDGCPIVHVDENDHAAVAVPTWGSGPAALVIAGRAESELGRLAIPSVASAIFNGGVGPRLGRFIAAHYGIGAVSVARLGEFSREVRRSHGPSFSLRGAKAGPNVLLRGSYADRPFYAAITFGAEDDRRSAVEAVQGFRTELFGEELRLHDVIAHPLVSVPARRFLLAAGLVVDDLSVSHHGAEGKRELAEPVPHETRLAARTATLNFVRSRCNDDERHALNLEQSRGYLFHATGDSLSIAEVIGGQGTRRSEIDLGLWTKDPFAGVRLDEIAQLEPRQRIGQISVSVTEMPRLSDPVIDALNLCARRATDYNNVQTRVTMPLDERELEGRIGEAIAQRRSDARAMLDLGLYPGLAISRPRRYELDVATVDDRDQPWIAEYWNGQLVVRDLEAGDVDEVRVRICTRLPDRPWAQLEQEGASRHTRGSGKAIVADLLGHREEDIAFE